MELDELDLDFDYGELANDVDFVNKCENVKVQMIAVEKILRQLVPLQDQYDKLSSSAQIELDLILAFMLNSLHWVSLRLKGVDPTTHPIKIELQRIKAAMVKWQQAKDRSKRPTVNVQAAKRFVRSGLYDHKQNSDQPPNKKIRFEDKDE